MHPGLFYISSLPKSNTLSAILSQKGQEAFVCVPVLWNFKKELIEFS